MVLQLKLEDLRIQLSPTKYICNYCCQTMYLKEVAMAIVSSVYAFAILI